MTNQQQTESSPTGGILVWFAIAVMTLVTLPQILGDLLAKPLERHRDKSTTVWLAWNFLRLSMWFAIMIVSLICIIGFLHRNV